MGNNVNGASFELFCNNYAIQKQQIHDECMNKVGQMTTNEIAAEYKKKNQELAQVSYDVMPEEWRTLVNKQNKTPEDFVKLDKMYKDAFKNLGESYIEHADSKYGTQKDKKLSLNEYLKSEGEEANPAEATNEFQILDQNGDTYVDGKEIAALLCMFDMDVDNGNTNGKLKYRDILVNQIHLAENPDSKIGIQMKNALKSAYEFLFGN